MRAERATGAPKARPAEHASAQAEHAGRDGESQAKRGARESARSEAIGICDIFGATRNQSCSEAHHRPPGYFQIFTRSKTHLRPSDLETPI